MEVIKEMISLIHKLQVNVIGIKEDKTEQLLQYITNGQANDEATLVKKMFPDSDQETYNYNRIKKNLKQRVINTMIARDPHSKEYSDIYFDVGKKDQVSNYLWDNSRGQAAAAIATEALKISVKYEFTDFSYSLSRRLTNHYALIVSDPAKYRKYRSIYQTSQVNLKWEKTAEDYYYDLAHHLRATKGINKDLIEKAESYNRELLQAPSKVSWTFEFIRSLIAITLGNMKNDGQGVIKSCEKSLSYFKAVSFKLPNRATRSLHLRLIPAYIQAQQYQLALSSTQKVKSLIPKTGYNWIVINQLEAIVGFHTSNLPSCSTSINEIKKNKLASRVREETRIYETYLSFLSGESIRMTTFLNDTPKFSLDKKGMNINRLILQILILLTKNDRAGIIDRAEALELYAYRHLSRDETTRRSQIFMRLLFLTVRHSFDWPIIEKQTAKTYAELLATPRHLSTIDIEVVPYEVLWARVQSILQA